MRLHRNLVFTVIDGLNEIYNEGQYADKVVQASLKRDKRWGARDRKFVAETLYDMVRWKRLYNEIAGTKNHYSRENIWKNFAVWAVLLLRGAVFLYFVPVKSRCLGFPGSGIDTIDISQQEAQYLEYSH